MSAPEQQWPRFGVHAGFYGGTSDASPTDELRRLWVAAESMGFDWVSVWDHFFDPSSADPGSCLDVVSMQSAMACTTERVRCGALVYCVSYRSPVVIASAIATIDHLSGGRAEIGLGAGWSRGEFDASGVRFLPFDQRIELLEETATAVRLLLQGDPVRVDGTHVRLAGARCHPGPVQSHLPIWLGGRSGAVARVAARCADGLNVPYTGPDVIERRRRELDAWAADCGRVPVRLSANLALALDEADYARQFSNVVDHVGAGVVVGGAQEAAQAAGRLLDAGTDQVNFTVRAPWSDGVLEVLGEALSRLR